MNQHRKLRAALLLTALLLAGCGFEPLMAQRQGGSMDELTRVRILPIPERSGQILRNHLLADLADRGRAAPSSHTLEIKLVEPRQEIAIRRDESASRVAYTATATFVLRDTASKTVFGGSSSSSSTYEAATSEFASIAGQQSARDRAMQEISTDIRQQLATYFFRVRRAAQPAAP